jgi:hypothetical protein
MSTHITGKLIRAGDYVEDEQVDPAAPMARVIVVMPRERLAAVERLPMYDEVTVIRTSELAELRLRLQHAEALIAARAVLGEKP